MKKYKHKPKRENEERMQAAEKLEAGMMVRLKDDEHNQIREIDHVYTSGKVSTRGAINGKFLHDATDLIVVKDVDEIDFV